MTRRLGGKWKQRASKGLVRHIGLRGNCMPSWEEACHKIAVSVIVLRGDRVLLLKEQEGHWQLPGGGVDPDEDPLLALFRELKEETGDVELQGGRSPST